MTRKKVIIGFVFLVGAIMGVLFFVTKQGTSSTGSSMAVKIDKLDTYATQMKSKGISNSIESAVAKKLVEDSPSNPRGQGTVRDKSFTKTTNGEGTPYFKFLVDIPDLKRTYTVTYLGGDDYEQSILYINCPEASELIYPALPCTRHE